MARLPPAAAPSSFRSTPAASTSFLDGLQDPGNLGAVARVGGSLRRRARSPSAPGCVHPNHPRALRASAGSLLRLAVAVDAAAAAVDDRLGAGRSLWAALAAHGGGAPGSGGGRRPLVLALGAEGPGLSSAVEGRCAVRWTIPLAGRVESLNVAVAAAVALFALSRRVIPSP